MLVGQLSLLGDTVPSLHHHYSDFITTTDCSAPIPRIENAIHAMKDGGTLMIETRQHNTTTEIVFTDSGCGIPADDLGKIFESLYTTKKKGLGLGLALSKSFAEANGGIILVESREGKGSTFTLRFGA